MSEGPQQPYHMSSFPPYPMHMYPSIGPPNQYAGSGSYQNQPHHTRLETQIAAGHSSSSGSYLSPYQPVHTSQAAQTGSGSSSNQIHARQLATQTVYRPSTTAEPFTLKFLNYKMPRMQNKNAARPRGHTGPSQRSHYCQIRTASVRNC